MKLQIAEYSDDDKYYYILLIEGRQGAWMTSEIPKDSKEVYEKLSRKIIDEYEDYTLEDYSKLNLPPYFKGKILSEIEISDTFFKEIKIKQKLKDLENDFV